MEMQGWPLYAVRTETREIYAVIGGERPNGRPAGDRAPVGVLVAVAAGSDEVDGAPRPIAGPVVYATTLEDIRETMIRLNTGAAR